MKNAPIGTLGFAMLGFLYQKPSTGYDLMKLFSDSPMRSFTDSPGAIYASLERMEKAGFIVGTVEKAAGLRQRKRYRATAVGSGALKTWLLQPVTREDIVSGMNEMLLRFAFLDSAVGEKATVRFLESLEGELRAYLPSLKTFLTAPGLPRAPRLALECGILGYQAQLKWASHALSAYQNER